MYEQFEHNPAHSNMMREVQGAMTMPGKETHLYLSNQRRLVKVTPKGLAELAEKEEKERVS